jgi:hypothetical protein
MREVGPALFGGCQVRENGGGNVSGGWRDVVEAILETLLDQAQAVLLGMWQARPLYPSGFSDDR